MLNHFKFLFDSCGTSDKHIWFVFYHLNWGSHTACKALEYLLCIPSLHMAGGADSNATPLQEFGIPCLVQGHFRIVLWAASLHRRIHHPYTNFSSERIERRTGSGAQARLWFSALFKGTSTSSRPPVESHRLHLLVGAGDWTRSQLVLTQPLYIEITHWQVKCVTQVATVELVSAHAEYPITKGSLGVIIPTSFVFVSHIVCHRNGFWPKYSKKTRKNLSMRRKRHGGKLRD